MPIVQRFTTTTRGAMILAGNTLNCRLATPYPPAGNDYGNGSYISTNTSLVVSSGFPLGTTNNPLQSSSTAVINIPSGSTILYAQLFWSIYSPSVPPGVDNPITFQTPVGNYSISPNLSLKQLATFQTFQAQDVKDFIQAGGSGIYSVTAVPGLQTNNGTTVIGNGWGLIIVYNNPSLPLRYFNVNTGIAVASAGAPSDFNFTGFQTSSIGLIKGYFLASESNGDLIDGAQILIGTTLGTSSKIGNSSTGSWNGVPPYAQINTMLPGNILIGDTNDISIGLLDTRGTFGTYNKNPFANTAVPFARTNMDILGVDISSKLLNNQTQLFTRVTYSGSGTGHMTSQSVQVDVNGIDFNPMIKSTDKIYADIGDIITYTITTTNMGNLTASNAVFIDTIPMGTTLVPGSAIVNNIPQTSFNPNPPSGYALGNIGANALTTIIYSVKVNETLPITFSPVRNQGTITYTIIGSSSTQFQSVASNITTTTISNVTLNSTKIVNRNYAKVGDILTYTIAISNLGNITAVNVVFVDTIPEDLTFIQTSFKQDGISIIGTPDSPGVTLPNAIDSLKVSTITYQLLVNTIPSPNPVLNSITAKNNYLIDPTTNPNTLGNSITNSNIVSTQINYANLENAVKYVDKSFADCGDSINYTIVITNTGNVSALNVVFKDTIPNGTSLLNGSFKVNGITIVNANPSVGVTIPNISPNNITTITFSVRVQC